MTKLDDVIEKSITMITRHTNGNADITNSIFCLGCEQFSPCTVCPLGYIAHQWYYQGTSVKFEYSNIDCSRCIHDAIRFEKLDNLVEMLKELQESVRKNPAMYPNEWSEGGIMGQIRNMIIQTWKAWKENFRYLKKPILLIEPNESEDNSTGS